MEFCFYISVFHAWNNRVLLGTRFQMFFSWEKKIGTIQLKSPILFCENITTKKFQHTYSSKRTIIFCIDFHIFNVNHLCQKLFLRTHLKIHNKGSTRSYDISNLNGSVKIITLNPLSLIGLCWNTHTLTEL